MQCVCLAEFHNLSLFFFQDKNFDSNRTQCYRRNTCDSIPQKRGAFPTQNDDSPWWPGGNDFCGSAEAGKAGIPRTHDLLLSSYMIAGTSEDIFIRYAQIIEFPS